MTPKNKAKINADNIIYLFINSFKNLVNLEIIKVKIGGRKTANKNKTIIATTISNIIS